MKRWTWVVLALVAGCDSGKKKDAGGAAAGSGSAATETGSAAGSGSAVAEAGGSGSAGSAADPAACDLNGNYRLRFSSNGAEGWWLRLAVSGGKDVKVTGGAINMLGLDEKGDPTITVDDKACTISIKKKTQQAGDLDILVSVIGNNVTGSVARTDEHFKGTTPITGVRETSPEKTPDCIKPGRYTLDVTGVKKWKLEGTPSDDSCEASAGTFDKKVFVDVLGGKLLIDEVSIEDGKQGFGRAKVTKTAECEADISYRVEDFDLKKGHIVFAGDSFKGTVSDFTFEVMEDGEDGENQWSCSTTQGDIVGKRIGD